VAKDGQKVSYDEIIVKKIVLMASDGNLKAAEIVIERVDGKVKQEHEISGDFGKVILPKEDVERIDVMFRAKPKKEKKDAESKQNGTAKDNRGGSQIPSGKPKGSAYERS
jgi:hypothetical protein